MSLQNQELRTEIISESVKGRPIHIVDDFALASDVTRIHVMTEADVIDSVHIKIHNGYSSSVVLNLIINPDDETSKASIDNATLTLEIPRYTTVEVLHGERVRFIAGSTYTIAAHVATADIGRLHVTGWYNRLKSGELTA